MIKLKKELITTNRTSKLSIKFLALFLAILSVIYLLPMSVFGERVADSAVNSEETAISEQSPNSVETEASVNPEASEPSPEVILTLTSSYQFETKDNNETSALISQYTSTVAPTGGTSASTTYLYKYDANGNITDIRIPNTTNYLKSNCTCAGLKQCDDECANGCQCEYDCGCHKTILQYRYAYDIKGQLIREDNRPLGVTYVWEYDNGGNILSKAAYSFNLSASLENVTPAYTRIYTYDGDRMTSFKRQSVTYDSIGNPTNYRGKRMTWQQGRQLASVLTSTGTYAYTYNADGLRIGKSNGSVTTEYILNGSQVMRQIISDGTTTYVADYIYHENGTPMAFAFYQQGGTPTYYFYETNLQGDIIAIYDENGSKVVGFRYDAWGSFNTDISNSTVCTDTFLRASLFRYRSYIYDYESNLYYLQSRYYDPETGRFINGDGYINANGDLVGYNLYAYCSNNPVNYIDPTGSVVTEIVAIEYILYLLLAAVGITAISQLPPPDLSSNVTSFPGENICKDIGILDPLPDISKNEPMIMVPSQQENYVEQMPEISSSLSDYVETMPTLQEASPNVIFSKGELKKYKLPTQGKIRFVPSKKGVIKFDNGFIDKFGNVWKPGGSRTLGESFEWDVQLSKQGRHQLGWATRDGSHLNVSLKGRITHK